MIFDLLYLLSPDESEFLDNEFDDDVSDSGSSVTYSFRALSFPDEYSVAGVLGSDIFAKIVFKSVAGVFESDVSIPT